MAESPTVDAPTAAEIEAARTRFETVDGRVAAACARAGRERSEVEILGACKRQPLARLLAAYEAGLRAFAENQVQSGEANRPLLPADTRWHLIGPLQSNKAKRAVEVFDSFHAVDRPKIARALNRHAEGREATAPLQCFLEVNLGAEASKHGFLQDDVLPAARLFAELPRLELSGLMAIPPRSESDDQARAWFRALRDLLHRLQDEGIGQKVPTHLSMGMSGDYEIAIEEGATHVRIGTALFGPRD